MILENNHAKLEIKILKRSNTQAVDYWDANWLDAEVKITNNNFTAHYRTNLRIDDIQRFYDSLIKLDKHSIKHAELNTIEEGIYLKLINQSNGMVLCSGKAIDNTGNTLEFAFITDLNAIENLLKQIKSLLKIYPVMGTPSNS